MALSPVLVAVTVIAVLGVPAGIVQGKSCESSLQVWFISNPARVQLRKAPFETEHEYVAWFESLVATTEVATLDMLLGIVHAKFCLPSLQVCFVSKVCKVQFLRAPFETKHIYLNPSDVLVAVTFLALLKFLRGLCNLH